MRKQKDMMIVVRRWPCDDSLLSLDQLPFCPGVLQTSGKFCLGKFSKFPKQHQHTLIFNNQEDIPLQKWFSFRGSLIHVDFKAEISRREREDIWSR